MKLKKLDKAIKKGDICFYCEGDGIIAQDKDGYKMPVGVVTMQYIMEKMLDLAPIMAKSMVKED